MIDRIKFPHNALDGVKSKWQKRPGHFRPELKAAGITSTFNAVLNGYRVMTSRTGYWEGGIFRTRGGRGFRPLDVGDQIWITTFKRNGGELLIPARVVAIGKRRVGEIIRTEPDYRYLWSVAQGWTERYLRDNPSVLAKYDILFLPYIGGKAIEITGQIKGVVYDIKKALERS